MKLTSAYTELKKLLTNRLGFVVFISVLVVASFGGYVSVNDDLANAILSKQPGLYRVIEINDGDTITVDMNGARETIRMLGVDTPETQHPDKPVQCFGKAATNFTKKLINNHRVRLEADPINTNRDRYNRLLRYVYLPDGTLVNTEIIRQGYGFAYTSFPLVMADEFIARQREARVNNLGLWTSCQIIDTEYGIETGPATN